MSEESLTIGMVKKIREEAERRRVRPAVVKSWFQAIKFMIRDYRIYGRFIPWRKGDEYWILWNQSEVFYGKTH